MPRLAAIRTVVPEFKLAQNEVREFAADLYDSKIDDLDRLLKVFDNSGIETRYFSRPLEWLRAPHTLAEKNEAYIRSATDLSAEAVNALLSDLDLDPKQIDRILYVNTTGIATPSIDARLINRLGLRSDIRRTPIWGLGCAGGAAGLSHACHLAHGHPQERILLVATELCGLTFISDDFSISNLVATALFAEGSAAALIVGDDVDHDGLEIVDTQSRFYPDSLDVMGWNVVSGGLQVVFQKRIPEIVAEHAHDELSGLLDKHQMTLDDIKQFLFHPGGRKVIEAYRQALDVADCRLTIASEILRDYGNMSSPTVLFVIEKYLEKSGLNNGGFGLISALGPGFSAETLLVRL